LTVYDLSVIPLFLLMGQFATQGGLSRALFKAAAAFVGHVRGGLGMAAILASAAFGAVCGSAVATSATITQVAYGEMKAHGYAGRLSTAVLATGGTLGILIPPSVPLVVYAILTEQNIAKLFAAAMLPGILAALGYIVVVAIYCRLRPELATPAEPLPWSQRWRALLGIWPIVLIFGVVFGGIYGGIFSPTEGAAVGALGTFSLGLARRELGWAGIKRSFMGTAETSAMVFMIFLGADMMNAALALTQMPAHLADWVGHQQVSPLLIVAGVLMFYVVLGCVMDELSMLLLTIPVIFPTIMGLDLWGLTAEHKAIWFGILVLTTVGIGLLAPPVGLNVYVVNSMARDVPMSETYKGVLPFLVWDALRMGLLLFVPSLSLWLVRLL
ncbi:MAG TPA: TRAP transporter large permease, partial [Roseateles sp.]|nr:TRAP transporter large permease [Roseateles sp.]